MPIQMADSPEAEQASLAEAVRVFINFELPARNYRKVTVQHYSQAVRLFQASLPQLLYVDQLDASAVQQYHTALKQKGLGTASLHVNLTAVKAFMSIYCA